MEEPKTIEYVLGIIDFLACEFMTHPGNAVKMVAPSIYGHTIMPADAFHSKHFHFTLIVVAAGSIW